MKIYSTFFLLFISSLLLQAQIGVNTESPTSLLDVVSSTATSTGKVLTTTNSDNKETMLIRNDGYIGIGVDPLVKLDLRSTTLAKENALGIGYTSQTAAQAKAGAIRYDETNETLEYSDGASWIRLQENPDRTMIIADIASNTFPVDPVGSTVFGPLTNWRVIYDKTGVFNATTGVFVAPHTGIYSISLTLVFEANILDQGQYEIIFNSSSGVNLKSAIPCFSPVSGGYFANSCKALFYLTTGQTIESYLYVLRTTNTTVSLSSDAALNVLTIAEM